jgi:hypothetical protein
MALGSLPVSFSVSPVVRLDLVPDVYMPVKKSDSGKLGKLVEPFGKLVGAFDLAGGYFYPGKRCRFGCGGSLLGAESSGRRLARILRRFHGSSP